MFGGYTLKLVKKKDIAEQEQFEKVTLALNVQLNDFISWMKNCFRADPESVKELTVNIEGLHSMADVYYHNKYSAPSTVIDILDRISFIRKVASETTTYVENLIDMTQLMEGILRIARASNAEPDEHEQIASSYGHAVTECKVKLSDCVAKIIANLQFIQLSIENDVIQIMMGVDIGELYKARQKCLKKQKDLVSRYTITFGIQSKSDDQFINKEDKHNE